MSENDGPVAPVQNIVHTPGPWKYHDAGSIVMTDDGQMSVADIRGFGRLEKDFGLSAAIKIMDKNGTLIAAAPDLLECVQAMLAEYEEGLTPRFDLREMCRVAVAKSKGEKYE